MSTFPEALPHGPIEEIFPNVFFVTGGFGFGPGLRITRNMVIVRRGTELVLLNSVRLTPDGEQRMEKLGKVSHVVRLGSFHGLDDPYYSHRYGVPIWAPAGIKHAPEVKDSRTLREGEQPLDGATTFLCEKGKVPEAAMILEQDGGVLVTCDSYQNWTTFDGCSFLGRLMMKAMGFGPLHIGGPWTKAMGPDVRHDLERLAKMPFKHLLPAHGAPLKDSAVAGLHTAIGKRFS